MLSSAPPLPGMRAASQPAAQGLSSLSAAPSLTGGSSSMASKGISFDYLAESLDQDSSIDGFGTPQKDGNSSDIGVVYFGRRVYNWHGVCRKENQG